MMCIHREYFRRDVVRSPHGSGASDQPFTVHLQTRPEVRQPDVSILVDQNIVRFDVSMETKQCK